MWNANKSLMLSRICTIVFMVILVVVAVFAPWIIGRFIEFSHAGLAEFETHFLISVYCGVAVAAVLLASLFMLLCRISDGTVFIEQNVKSLRLISWCCFFGAIISLVSAIYYYPWAVVAVAAAFMGLIVRVIKNVFAKAVSLQDEADFTI